MAIDLPPAIPPQASTVEQIVRYAEERAEDVVSLPVGNINLRITGNRHLSEHQLRQLTSAASTPSQAIRAINQAYYQLGHLLITTYYAPRGSDIYVHVVNGRLDNVFAPPGIAAHFKGLLGEENIRLRDFERRRVLADLKSERSGIDYSIRYEVGDDPEAVAMVFTEQPQENHKPVAVSFKLSNEGNRFLGRYFAGAGIRQSLSGGSEFSLTYDRAIPEWGENLGGKSYDGLKFNFNHPSRFGLYGLDAGYARYEREALASVVIEDTAIDIDETLDNLICTSLPLLCDLLPLQGLLDIGNGLTTSTTTTTVPVDIDAEIYSVALTGEQVLFSDRRQRLTFSQRLEYTSNEAKIDSGPLILDEQHGSLELGLRYYRHIRFLDRVSRFGLQTFVEQGLTSDSGSLGSDDRDGVVSIGARTAEYTLFKPKVSLKMALTDHLVFDADVVGQLANEQLPQQRQFVLGGISSLSAYLPGVLVGDSGYYGRLALESDRWKWGGVTFKPSLFVEYGQARFENASGSAGSTRSITDAGIRLMTELPGELTLELVAARSIAENNVPQDLLDQLEVDFFFRVAKTFSF